MTVYSRARKRGYEESTGTDSTLEKNSLSGKREKQKKYLTCRGDGRWLDG